MRKELPLLITTVFGLLMVFGRWFWLGQLWGIESITDQWIIVSNGFAVAIGVVNLTQLHGRNVQRRREHWPYSLVLIVAMYGYMAIALYETVEGPTATWLYDGLFTPIGSAMFALIAFYITSAAYRVFRVRTREATVLMICAVITMLGMAPIGEVLISGWHSVAEWGMDVPVSAAFRGITIGARLGFMATAMRIILGLERAHLGGYGAS